MIMRKTLVVAGQGAAAAWGRGGRPTSALPRRRRVQECQENHQTTGALPPPFSLRVSLAVKGKASRLGNDRPFWGNPWLGWVNDEAFLGCGKGGFAVVAG